MSKLIDLTTYPIRNVLSILLQDKTTKKNIIWATEIFMLIMERDFKIEIKLL